MSVIQKLYNEASIELEVNGSELSVGTLVYATNLSIEDVKNLITELNDIHTEMVVNKHKETLNKNK